MLLLLLLLLLLNLHRLRVTNEVEGNKSNGFKFFDKCLYSFEQEKSWGVRLTIKILKHSKVRLTRSLVLRPNGRIFLAFGAPSQNFFAGIPQGRGLVRTLCFLSS